MDQRNQKSRSNYSSLCGPCAVFPEIWKIFQFQVTKLERDPGSGSSLQEMTFWLNLERALQKILQKRESEEVSSLKLKEYLIFWTQIL